MEQPIDGQPATTTATPRNVFIAFLLSLFFPGLGQVYNGQPKKAIFLFCLRLLIPLLFGLTRGVTFFYGLLSLVIMEIVLRIYIIIDGVVHAKRQKNYTLKPYNTWYYLLLIAVAMITIQGVYDLKTVLGAQVFKIPTTSNSPTLHPGDWVMADMRAYKDNEPDYGDLVVYSSQSGQLLAFRVVGKPNDSIELIDNVVSINGKPGKANFIRETINDEILVTEFEEELPNGHKHLIYTFKLPYDNSKTNVKNIVVPPGSYYLLGDNRDNAADSRYEGFITKDKIKGRILYSYWGQSGVKRMNINF